MEMFITIIITLCVLVIIADYANEIFAKQNLKEQEEEMKIKSRDWLLKNLYR
jgi:hypothetical protein